MTTDEIIKTIHEIKIGDKLSINDWNAKYTVCGVSQRFILAHYGQHYTIIDKTPFPYTFNAVREGDIRCAPDWWLFGYVNGYYFTNEEWVKEYLTSLETGETELSQKKHAPVWFISVVGRTDKVYAKKKSPRRGLPVKRHSRL